MNRIIALFLCLVMGGQFFGPDKAWAELNVQQRPRQAAWVFDEAGLMDDGAEQRLNQFLAVFQDDTDIEFLAVTVPNLDGQDINAWTNALFENWQVGRTTQGHRGLLLVIAVAEQQVRLEVGLDLEGLLTDAFTGYIEREQMKPFFEQGRVADGLEATLEIGRAHV